jgi:hypothetical protein
MSDPTPKNAELARTSQKRNPRRALITGFPVVIDACVLVNSTVRDFVLWAAYLALYRPVWSADIISEVRKTLLSFGIARERVEYTIAQIENAFPEAMVEGYEALVPVMTNAESDRHVVAAGIIGKAQLIVTQNLKDFPSAALEAYRIEACNADDFLRDLLDVDQERMVEVLISLSKNRKMPPKTVDDLLDALEANGCPNFAADMREVLKTIYADS